MVVFTLSSLAAGLTDSGGVLIGSRAIQGIGAALLMPTTLNQQCLNLQGSEPTVAVAELATVDELAAELMR